jgi:hypothetical protein
VGNSYRQHVEVSDTETLSRPNRVRMALGLARPGERLDRVVEDVSKPGGEPLHCISRTVHLDWHLTPIGKRTDVVDAHDVIRVVMRKQNGVDAADIRGDELQAQLRRSVDEDSRSTVRLDQRADAGPFIPWVRRPAHIARASDLWDAKACSCSQEGELQTVSTLSRLVVPGISKGTPAVTMMRSPFDASSLSATTLLVRCIISS